MGKAIDHDSMDLALNDLKNNADELHICSQEPVTYAEVAIYTLANCALAPGDFTLGDGDVSGRKLTLAQKAVMGTDDGAGDHAVLVDTGNSALKAVTTCPEYAIADGVSKNVAAYDVWEIEDPT